MPLPVVAAGAAAPALWPWYAAMGAAGVGATLTGLEGIRRGAGRGRQFQGPPAPSGSPQQERQSYMNRMNASMGGGRGSRRVQPPTGGSPAPGAPGAGGRAYVSPFAGNRDATVNRARQIVPAAPAATQPAVNATPVGYGAPPVVGTPAARTQRERVNEMLQNAGVQQPLPPMESLKPYWAENPSIAKAAAEGPKAGDVGYSNRADIQAWMEANKNAPKGPDGKNIVERFVEQQRKRGLIPEESDGIYNPVFTQQQLADVDATQSPAFSQGRDKILSMRGSMLEPQSIDQLWSPGFRQSDPVDWDSAMSADLVMPGSGAAKRREELNRVLEMPGEMMKSAPSPNPSWAAGYSQSQPVNWDAAVNSRHNIPAYEVPSKPIQVSAGYGDNGGLNWNAAMKADLVNQNPIASDALEMGQRFTNPDEQRRYRAGLMLKNQIQSLKGYYPGAQQ